MFITNIMQHWCFFDMISSVLVWIWIHILGAKKLQQPIQFIEPHIYSFCVGKRTPTALQTNSIDPLPAFPLLNF